MSEKNIVGGLKDVKSSLSIQDAPVQNAEVPAPKKELSTFDIDCLWEIFDWLTLKDLLSISKTCKRLQWVAGDFFQTNYSALQIKATPNGVYAQCNNENIQINDFYHFIVNVLFPITPFPNYQLYSFQQFEMHSNKSLKRIKIEDFSFSSQQIDQFKNQLKSVETLIIDYGNISKEFYKKIRSICVNLKNLHMHNTKITNTNDDSLEQYEGLKHLEWTSGKFDGDDFKMPLLKRFFEENPNIRNFTTQMNNFWENRHIFIESNIKFEILSINLCFQHNNMNNLNDFYNLLNEYYEKSVYKSLYLTIDYIDQQNTDKLKILNALKYLKFKFSLPSDGIDMSNLIILKEFSARDVDNLINVHSMVIKLVNLEKIHIVQTSIDKILPFICHSTKLNTIHVQYLTQGTHFDGNILDLSTLNKYRNKLNGAHKLTIYISDKIYVATKWAMNLNRFNLIEIKRIEAYNGFHAIF